MKELRDIRRFLRFIKEEKSKELKIVFLNKIFLASKIAKRKIDKENFVYKELLKRARNEIEKL